jgi:hypothetical protein
VQAAASWLLAGNYSRLSEAELQALGAKPKKAGLTCLRTPGGHTAFFESDLVAALEVSGQLQPLHALIRVDPQKTLERLDAPTLRKETKMAQTKTRAYQSPMGDIPSKDKKSAKDGNGATARDLIKVVSKSANDPNDPKQEQAKELLRLLTAFLDDEDETEASAEEDARDATRPNGTPPAARVRVTNLSPYAAQLDSQMGLSTAGKGVRVQGDRLILSSTQPRGMR